MTALSLLTLSTTVGDLNASLNTIFPKTNLLQQKTQQNTIYVDENGHQKTTSVRDLSNINTKEIAQIGFSKMKKVKFKLLECPKQLKKFLMYYYQK